MEIDLEFLNQHNLSPNQFVILETLTSGIFRKEKFKRFNATEQDVQFLVDKGYIVNERDDFYSLTEDAKEILIGDNLFQELIDAFPTKVTRPDGNVAYLKRDRKRSNARYIRITRNRRDIHEHILKCLKFEIQERTRTDNLKWMQTLPNWLQSEGWLEWADRLKERKESPIEESEVYGTELI